MASQLGCIPASQVSAMTDTLLTILVHRETRHRTLINENREARAVNRL